MPVIVHLDLDAFFASCERVRTPELADQGVVICMYSGRGEERGAVSTADYTARELGIHAGMPLTRAHELAADADQDVAFLPADKAYYKAVSEQVMDCMRDHVGRIEVASIDEAYGDVTTIAGADDYDAAAEHVITLKQEITEAVGVTASAGIGPNKLIAKMASDRDKPDGLTVVPPDDVDTFLSGLPVEELYGVGPKTAQQLADIEVDTVDGLREVSVQRLIRTFGENRGVELHEKAQGNGSTTLEAQEKKQLSRLTTLEQDTRDMRDIRPVIRELADDVISRVQQHNRRYATVSALFVTDEMEMKTRSQTLKAPVDGVEPLFRTAEQLAQTFLSNHPDTTVRRAGVRVGNLSSGTQSRLDGF